ncbi:hypothetical protein PVT68_06200 [Microbulbifer bruguierae]|uniref:Membrane protein YkvI n=1 Tax=Microbulbifer bruguierae TaxID=3029061 RepID=A0ABY8NHF8_9GAMM|nr:hypothetical protein [Microbulbifer bruguierae]WGL17885.1 hypothetical protein PVT68_06200 [Microbulbifer bruguierae]
MNWYRNYLLPGLIFQSVVIGGGYATGRELIAFFFASGPVGGLLGLLTAGVVFGVVLAIGFEFARVFRAFDYRHFCQKLLGSYWGIFELAFCIQLLLTLSVIGSAAGQLVEQTFGVPSLAGTLLLMSAIVLLLFFGSETIKRALAGWSFLLYLVYGLMFVLAFRSFGSDITQTYREADTGSGWLQSGVLYSGYNLAVLPAVLFAISGLSRRREAVGAGLMAGVLAIIPAMSFFVAMMAAYPEIGEQAVPATYLMSLLNVGWLEVIFQVVVFGTFIETGTALLHAVNERLAGLRQESQREMPSYQRAAVAVLLLGISIFAAERFGIVDLIAQGYGALTLVFLTIFILPLMTLGVWKIVNRPSVAQAEADPFQPLDLQETGQP